MAANSLSDSYETLVDTDNWMLFAAALVGFMARWSSVTSSKA